MEDDHDKVRALQRHPSSVFAEAVPQIKPNTVKTPNQRNNIVVSVLIIEKQLHIMNAKSAPGPDEIHLRVLKHLASVLAAQLENIFTKSMETGRLPPAWESALVKLMFKGEIGMIQPTSLTSAVGKFMKGWLRMKLRDTLRKKAFKPLLSMDFKRSRSCVTNLLVAREEWVRIADSGHRLDIIFIDFSRAFDHVLHEYPPSKLIAHWIKGKVLDWIRDFLDGRSMNLRVNEALWETVTCESGVPQRSVLRPVLFKVC